MHAIQNMCIHTNTHAHHYQRAKRYQGRARYRSRRKTSYWWHRMRRAKVGGKNQMRYLKHLDK